MTIRIRLALAFSLAALLLSSGHGYYQLHREKEDLRASVKREVLMLGRSMQAAVENALRDRQLTDVQHTLERLERVEPNVDIVVFDRQKIVAQSAGGPTGDPALRSIVDGVLGQGDSLLKFEEGSPGRVLLGLPLFAEPGGLVGCLVLVRPVDDQQRDLAATSRRIAEGAALMALLMTVLGFALSTLYVGRPLGRVIDAMRSVRTGELATRLTTGRRDEIGALAREFNHMIDDLAEARRRLVQEGEARIRMERGLQRVDKMATIGQVAATLAHEIGSPLQVLNGRARLLLERAHDPTATARNAEVLVLQTDRISRIVERLLHLARRGAPAVVSFDIVSAVRGVVDLLTAEARRRGVDLALTTVSPSIVIDADPDGLQQVALNLMWNALAATPTGGRIAVELRLMDEGSSEYDAVSTPTAGSPPTVRLSVTDTGHGIPADVRAHLFEPFFTTRASEGGTGLGLAVVRAIVAAHEGTVTLESEAEQGTTFHVDLPVRAHAYREVAA